MRKKLIIKAFEKAKRLKEEQGEQNPSLSRMAEDISEFIEEKEGLGLHEKNFRNYKNEAEKLTDSNEDINITQLKIINGLCKYIGYKNYADFVLANEENWQKKIILLFKKYRTILIGISIGIISIIILISINTKKWMEWSEDIKEENYIGEYVKTSFDADKLTNGTLKLYKEERILYFKQIIPDCNTPFFKKDHSENLWYGKNAQGELEYFTDLGLHPETGKTLKKITPYMIRKYICDTF